MTPIFTLERYRAVMNAYLSGPRGRRRQTCKNSSRIQSVASFFVSRVDTEIDKPPRRPRTDEARALRRQGRHGQRPAGLPGLPGGLLDPALGPFGGRWAPFKRSLWASTGVKDPAYTRHDVRHRNLIALGMVNTMPEKTLDAIADHGEIDR